MNGALTVTVITPQEDKRIQRGRRKAISVFSAVAVGIANQNFVEFRIATGCHMTIESNRIGFRLAASIPDINSNEINNVSPLNENEIAGSDDLGNPTERKSDSAQKYKCE
jgi:hypothetical protein